MLNWIVSVLHSNRIACEKFQPKRFSWRVSSKLEISSAFWTPEHSWAVCESDVRGQQDPGFLCHNANTLHGTYICLLAVAAVPANILCCTEWAETHLSNISKHCTERLKHWLFFPVRRGVSIWRFKLAAAWNAVQRRGAASRAGSAY